MRIFVVSILILAMTVPVFAKTDGRVSSRDAFLAVLDRKPLTHIGVRLIVTPDGRIFGRALGRDVSGAWFWEAGYFCRQGQWGNRAIPMNCQEVRLERGQIRFTSDRGTGQSVKFYLN